MDVTNGRSHDWERIERLPEFRELVARRRRFVLPATAFFLVWYFGFIVLAGYAEDFMGTSIHEGFTVGYGLALTQFVMVGVLGLWYLRYSERNLDPLRVRIAEQAATPATAETAVAADPNAVHEGRFDRPPPESAAAPGEREAER
ncbi:MAG: hypothetical protein QOH72_819 [Solirubrobacteraceae bacterium]|jgi:uncharacterized membrane protein (DUF485 family)|nr:hypothetical protein [Solirubrobacteraceae bacterium]